MTRRVAGSNTAFISRGEPITANWLNDIVANVAANTHKIQTSDTQEPVGQDGDGTVPPITLTEVPGTAVFGSAQRIEDDTDPTVYVEIRNKIEVTMTDQDGTTWTLNFEDTVQP